MADRSRPLILAAVVSTGLLAACSDIPTAGPVVAGNPVRAQDPLPYVAFGAAAPREGDDQAGIVDGFLDAMSAYQPGYEIAKLFLTPDAAADWDPAEGILIHRGTRPIIDVAGDDLVKVTLTVSGEVWADGSYLAAEPRTTRQFELPLEQVDGEWRIADAPAGTIISEDNFAREFEAHRLCFFDPDFEVFVYDPVYVPKNGQTATLLAQMLLAGPSEWLDPAVRSAFPESVSLGVPSVPVEAGTATVDLSVNAQEAQPVQRELMAAQLACTFAGLPEVSQLVMNADGLVLHGADGSAISATVDDRFNPDRRVSGGVLHAVQENGVVRRLDDGIRPVEGVLGITEGVVEVAVSPSGTQAAVVGAAGTVLQVAAFGESEARQTVLEETVISSPSWDRNDVIWAVSRDGAAGRIVAVRPDGAELEVRSGELDGRDVTRVVVSPDGARVALIADGEAYTALIVRDGDADEDVAIERLRHAGPGGRALDVGWAGADRIALLLQPDDDAPAEVMVLDTFGGVQATRGAVPGAIRLAAAYEQRLVVATEDGVLMEHESRTRWLEVGEGTAPAYP